MAEISKRVLQFHSEAVPEDPFQVVAVAGTEEISRPFRFELQLVSKETDLDFTALLTEPCWLGIKQGVEIRGKDKRGAQLLKVHGVLSDFEQGEMGLDWVTYRAVLVPTIWRMSLGKQSRIFQNVKTPDIVKSVLQDSGLSGEEFEFDIDDGSYPEREYVVQYGESDLDFISRLLEHEGIFYLFAHEEDHSKLVFVDSARKCTAIQGEPKMPYHPKASALSQADSADAQTITDVWMRREVVRELTCKQKAIPKELILKDYNYRKPQLDLKSEATISDGGFGTVYEYGTHYKDTDEGKFYAQRRAEERNCREKLFLGVSDSKSFRAGATFTLEKHYRKDFNADYLIVEVKHSAEQGAEMESGGSVTATYENAFVAIPADAPFRPERLTPRPKIEGTITAKIDASTDGSQAELDEQGRYKVKFPFDLSDAGNGNASRAVRMAQPSAGPIGEDGQKTGMHLPLHKGTEVMLTHIEGDPDRPIIAGSVPNPDTESPSVDDTQTKNIIRDHYGNEIVLDATPGSEHIRIFSPHHKSGIQIGKSVNHWTESDHHSYQEGNKLEAGWGTKSSFYAGAAVDAKAAFIVNALLGLQHNFLLGGNHSYTLGYNYSTSYSANVSTTGKDHLFVADEDVILGAGDEFCIAAGTKEKEKNPHKNKTVIRATGNGITLGIGSKLTETGDGKGKGTWYLKDGGSPADWLMGLGAALMGLLSTTVGALAIGVAADDKNKERDHWWRFAAAESALFMAFSIAASAKLWNDHLRDSKIEPVRNVAPAQKIWMHEMGTVGMVSTKGEAKNDGSKGTVVLGVNEQATSGDIFYDQYKNWPGGTSKEIKLGDGTNIVIEKEKLEIRVGREDKNPSIVIEKDGKNGGNLTIKSGKDAESIFKMKKTGVVGLSSKSVVYVNSGDTISLRSKKNIRLRAEGSVLAKGSIKHKNFTVIA